MTIYKNANAIIPNGTALSGVIDMEGMQAMAIQMPSAWTTANITFLACPTIDGTFNDVYDDVGLEVTVTASASKCIAVNTNILNLLPFRFIKIRSGTTATPVNQGAERALVLMMKR